MQIQLQAKFCLLCVLSVIFPQSYHCHEVHTHDHHHHHHDHHHHDHHHHHEDHHSHHNHSAHPQGGITSEDEQQFYISQLFQRYGSSERLDFAGFQNLLQNLGLGEIKLVKIDHEELGHNHVAHLDILDVQNGLHSHADVHEGHHEHHRHQHETSGKQHVTEQTPTQCTRTTAASTRATAASTRATAAGARTTPAGARSGERKHDIHRKHDPHLHHGHSHGDHHHHHHHQQHHTDKARDEKLQNGPTEKDNHDSTDSGDQKHEYSNHTHNDHDDQGSGRHLERTEMEHEETLAQSGEDREHLHKIEQDLATSESQSLHQTSAAPPAGVEMRLLGSTLPPVGVEQQLSRAVTEGKDRKRKRKGRGRGQAGDREAGGERSKREVVGGLSTPTAPALIGPGHSGVSTHQHDECLNLTQLLTDFGLRSDALISPAQFSYLCPALLYQIDRRLCLRHYHSQEVEQHAIEPTNSVMVWVSGFVSITIISLLSLLGVVLVPILNQGCFKFLLTFLVALAVGTLSGDALLHLLPHSQGQHNHSSDLDQDSDLGTEFDGVWKGLMALGGIYLLFIIEHCLGMYKHYKEHKSSETASAETVGRKLSDHKLNRRSDAEWLHLKALPEDSGACESGGSDSQITDVQSPDSTSAPPGHSPKKNGHKPHGHAHGRHGHTHGGHGHSHGGHCHSDQDMKDAGIASIAWMVIMGDGMHNFSDGLAIGAAFSANVTGGISTSVAVFCHELPHELGDFAVLLKAGMSVKQALVYNVLSALMAYVGMVIGTAVGQYTHNVTSWIFAITAGMFLYVALVDMLPEMLHGDSEDHKRCHVGHFLLQNLGLLSGFCIMLLIAIYEDQIVFDFKF